MTKPVPPSQFQSRGPTKPESPPVLFQASPEHASVPKNPTSAQPGHPQPAQESSSLFSLSSLQDLATSVSIAPNSPQQQPEGSGMLDVRALADAAKKKESDPFMVAAPGPGPAATLISTPERLLDREESSRKRMVAALAVMAVAVLALGGTTAFLAVRTRPTALGQESVASAPATEANLPPPVPSAPSTPAPAALPAAPVQAVPAAPAVAPAPAARVPAPAPVATVKPSTRSEPAAGGEEAAREHHHRARAESASSDDMNPTPSREEVLAAMQKVTPRVAACGHGASGMALAKVTVSGATGRVTSVEVDGADLGAAKACIVHEVSRAKFPAFSNPSFSVTYPFRL